MEFLKHNWFKLLAAVLALAGAIFMLIQFISVSNALSNFDAAQAAAGTLSAIPLFADLGVLTTLSKESLQSGLLFDLAIFLSLVAIIVAIVISMFHSKKIAGITLAAGGLIALILAIVAISVGMPYLQELANNANTAKTAYDGAVAAGSLAPDGLVDATYLAWQSALYNYQMTLFGNIINIFVFAIAPLAFGLKKIFCKCCKKDAAAK